MGTTRWESLLVPENLYVKNRFYTDNSQLKFPIHGKSASCWCTGFSKTIDNGIRYQQLKWRPVMESITIPLNRSSRTELFSYIKSTSPVNTFTQTITEL